MTTMICRGWSHTLRCPEPSVLHLTQADFITSQCRTRDLFTGFHGNGELHNCSSALAFQAVTSRCNGYSSCILSDESLFAETCEWPGNSMLRLGITCHKASASHVSLVEQSHKVSYAWTTPQANLLSLDEAEINRGSVPTSATSGSTSKHRIQLTKTSKTQDALWSERVVGFCTAIIEGGVLWPETKAGLVAKRGCPGGARGEATWLCVSVDSNQTDWEEQGPDLRDCASWTIEVDKTLREATSIGSLRGAASKLSSAVQALNENEVGLNAADLRHASDIMTEIAECARHDTETTSMKTTPNERGKLMLLNEAMAKAGDKLIGLEASYSWVDLNDTMKHKVGINIISSIEESAFLLADEMKGGDARVISEDNIMLGVKIQNVEKKLGKNDIVFPFLAQDGVDNRKNVTDSIWISSEDVEKNQEDGETKVVFAWFDNLGQFVDGAAEHKSMNSRIISATMKSTGRKIILEKPAIIIFQHITPSNESRTCVYWNLDLNVSGRWLSDGCKVYSSNSTHTVCACNHLTSFAVLVNHRGFSMEEDKEILELLTRIGLSTSLVCLALSIMTFLSFRSLRCTRTTIHTNLCICLFLSQLIFLVGIDLYNYQIVCSVIAGVLHYCFLATFVWMALEGFQLYVMLVEVFERNTSTVWYYLAGYGFPAIFVASSAGLNPDGYGTETSCWLKTKTHGSPGSIGSFTPFIWAFVAPAFLVALGNLGFLVLTAVTMYRKGRKYIFYSRIKAIKSSLKSTFALLCLLGTTWILGLVWWWEGMLVLQYLFCIFNAFQGVYIFVFHCLFHSKVRYEYRKLFSKCTGESYSGVFNSSTLAVKYTGTRRSMQDRRSQKGSSVRKGSVRANYYDGQLKTDALNLREASEHFSTQDRASMKILFTRKESMATPYLPTGGSMDNTMLGHHLRSYSTRSCPGKGPSPNRRGPHSKEGPLKRACSERKYSRRRYNAPVSERVSRILKSAGSTTGIAGCRYLPAKAWEDGTPGSTTTRSTSTTTSTLPQEGSTLARYHIPKSPPSGPNMPAKQFKLVDKRLAKFKKINSSPSLGRMVRSSSMNSAEKKRRELQNLQLSQPSTSVPDLMSQLSAKIESRDISQVLLMYLDKDGTLNRQKMDEDRRADDICKNDVEKFKSLDTSAEP